MIKTERLTLVPIDIKYSKDLFYLWSDYEVIKYTNTKIITTQEECCDRVKLWVKQYTDKEVPNNFVILLNDKAIGIIGFPVVNKANKEFGFFYQIAREYWGNGYATESSKTLIEYIVRNYNKVKLYAGSVFENKASITILNKVGFTQVNIEKNGFNNLDIINFEYNNR